MSMFPVKHPGALHRQLGIAEGEKIPPSTLQKYKHSKGKLGQRVRYALNMISTHKK